METEVPLEGGAEACSLPGPSSHLISIERSHPYSSASSCEERFEGLIFFFPLFFLLSMEREYPNSGFIREEMGARNIIQEIFGDIKKKAYIFVRKASRKTHRSLR